ncbi:TRAP transporter large permease subunit [Ponticaulis sp.]|uniref:TRAP transporter large permease n=1 Tax=Ponticaulis sp. TaxID=2020902 RepID=UPI000B702922|nr:TRAP transporter large permease subunit [Ponticaulis sp.]MAI89660.1 tripartite transporter [Ponticaulis sp.]OUY00680.1 MAG: tripartite transporter [Hyphomonadaceae bacterium TMED5]
MELEIILALLMFAAAIGGLLAGYPVALTLGGVALLFALVGIGLGVFPEPHLLALPSRIHGGSVMQNDKLIPVPLFILMGVILERSRIAEDLLHIASRLLGKLRGGLGFAVILVGALLAASTGIVGATVITMTLIALPSMLRQNYNPRLASGTIAASGTLGQIVPPSIVLILLADAVSNAANRAATEMGPGTSFVVSVGDLFAGALLPGLLLVGLYMAYVAMTALLRPQDCPPVKDDGSDPLTLQEILFGLGAPLFLILAVLGSMLGGIASPTQAAAIGAAGALMLAGLRLSDGEFGIWQKLIVGAFFSIVFIVAAKNLLDLRMGVETIHPVNMVAIVLTLIASVIFLAGVFAGGDILHQKTQLVSALKSAVEITSMVFLILIGASLFSLVFRGFGGDDLVHDMLAVTPGGKWGALIIAMLVMFLLGFFLDFIEIVFVVVPLVTPPLIIAGFDPVWLGILMALNLQTSFLTPPFGFALFYLRGAAPDELKTLDIWRGALPFIGLQILMILMVATFPALATWLPSLTR